MKNWLYKVLFSGVCVLAGNLNAQQITTTTPNITPVQAVQDILLGAGINAFNIEYNASAANAGVAQNNVKEFTSTGATFPIETGVLMTTNGTGVLNDPDLNTITGGSATNGAIIEFDFVPTGDTLSFNYIFASAEYSSYTCSDYNDVFGFFISGPGITGPYTNNAMNIATVPGTNVPVAINTVNSGSPSGSDPTPCNNADPNWQSNSIYFTTSYNPTFSNSTNPVSSFNGSTVVLPANATLSCGDTFHIKLAVANDFDQVVESGVFLEAKSFKSNVIQVGSDAAASINVLDSVLIEGCSEGTLTFIRPDGSDINDTLSAPLFFSGTATQGVDFNQLFPGDSVVILPGEDTVTVSLIPIADGINEGLEDITISVLSITVCGDSVYSDITFYFDDETHAEVSVNDTTLYCLIDSAYLYASTQGGFAPYTYNWSNGDVGENIWYSDLQQGVNPLIVESTDACGFTYSDTAFVEVIQTLSIDSMNQIPASCGESDGTVLGFGSGFTGTPDYEWRGPGANSPDFQDASTWTGLSAGWYHFSIEDDVCIVRDSILLEQDPPPTAAFTADPTVGGSPLTVQFTNESDPADTYEWNFGNGDSITVNDLSGQSATYIDEGFYTVTLVISSGSCTNQASEQIEVILLMPLHYDMPNVFTPNGDGSNDFFTLNTENAVTLDLVILNRWGNVVYESNDVNAAWNGRVNNNGLECTDGTYFYKFTIMGEDAIEIKEHGFVHLIRTND